VTLRQLDGTLVVPPGEPEAEKSGEWRGMKRTRIAVLCIAVVCALGAAGAPSALAKAKVLELRAGEGPIPSGGEVELAAGAFKFESTTGTTECEAAIFAGTLTTNSATKDVGSLTSATFQREEPEKGGHCTTEGAAYPAAPVASAGGLPWTVTFRNNYQFEIVAKPIRFELSGAEGSCAYEAKKLKGTYSITPSGQFEPELFNQKLKLAKHQSTSCAKELLGGIAAPYIAFVAFSNGEIIDGVLR